MAWQVVETRVLITAASMRPTATQDAIRIEP